LAWGLLFFILIQIAWIVALEGPWLELRDPEFAYRLARLREARAERPDSPLLLILGSSRAAAGFRPAALPSCRLPDGREPLVFNFALVGSGPIEELLCWRRLREARIRPDYVAI